MAETSQPARPVLPGEDQKVVTLREFEQRLSDFKNFIAQLFASERELRETITEQHEAARELNAKEVLRRLDELNHAHKTAMENWARSLPREMFIQFKEEHDKWKASVDLALASTMSSIGAIKQLELSVGAMEKLTNKVTGAFVLLGAMGVAGVIALILGIARLTGVVN